MEPNAAAAEGLCCWTAAAVLLRSLRWSTIVVVLANALLLLAGALLAALLLRGCGAREMLPAVLVAVAAGARIGSTVGAGVAQEVIATWILRSLGDVAASAAREQGDARQQRRIF